MTLTDGLRNAGRVIVCDNFFISMELANLLHNARTYILGTLRKNRQGNPAEFVRENLDIGQHKYIFKGFLTLLKLQVRRDKMCHILSTFHHSFQTNAIKNKPSIVCDYNLYKSGTDILDMMIEEYFYYPR